MRAEHAVDVIVNPASANGRTGRHWTELSERLEARGLRVHTHLTSGRGDATKIARALADAGTPEIVVVGGDGTLNEVVNGVLCDGQPVARTTLSVIPAGTGRDVARSLGLRSQQHAIEIVGSGPVCPIDAGLIRYGNGGNETERYFVGFADVGLGAETAARINQSSKALGGFVSYLTGAVRTIATFHGHPLRVTVDGEPVYDGDAAIVVLANGRFFGGGMRIAPMASMTDGRFEIFVLCDVRKRVLLTSVLPRVYLGKHVGLDSVIHCQGRDIHIEAPQPILFQSDGEQPGTTDIRALVMPGALRVRAPGRVGALAPAS